MSDAPPIRLPLSLASPPSGEHFEFHTSARGPHGKFRFTWTLAPKKRGPAEHTHVAEPHRGRLVKGRLSVWLDGKRHEFTAGDELDIPLGVAHRFLNPGEEPAVVEAEHEGTIFEDFAIPLAVEAQRRGGKMTLGLMALTLVQMSELDPTVPTRRTKLVYGVLGVFVRIFRLCGVRPLPPVIGWDQPRPELERASPPRQPLGVIQGT